MQASPPDSFADGTCNADLPNDSVYTRFLYIVRYLARNNFYVVLDSQTNVDTTIVDDPQKWVQLWTKLATDLNSDGVTTNRVLFDVANEADSQMFLWDAGNGLPGMTANYIAAMDALYAVRTPAVVTNASHRGAQNLEYLEARVGVSNGFDIPLHLTPEAKGSTALVGVQVNPAFLFMIQGLAQPGLSICWGAGLSTNATAVSQFTGAYTAASFFDKLLDKPYVGNVIIAPHFYGPSIAKNTEG